MDNEAVGSPTTRGAKRCANDGPGGVDGVEPGMVGAIGAPVAGGVGDGVGLGCVVGAGLGAGLGVGLAVWVGDGSLVGVGSGEGVALGVTDGVSVGDGDADGVGVAVLVSGEGVGSAVAGSAPPITSAAVTARAAPHRILVDIPLRITPPPSASCQDSAESAREATADGIPGGSGVRR
jgi:hypothetical protein